MQTFSLLLVLCEGNPPVTGGFPSINHLLSARDAGEYSVIMEMSLAYWVLVGDMVVWVYV